MISFCEEACGKKKLDVGDLDRFPDESAALEFYSCLSRYSDEFKEKTFINLVDNIRCKSIREVQSMMKEIANESSILTSSDYSDIKLWLFELGWKIEQSDGRGKRFYIRIQDLRSHQSEVSIGQVFECTTCGNSKQQGHDKTCEVGLALKGRYEKVE